MQTDNKSNIFEEIKSYGFNDVDKISLYENSTSSAAQTTEATSTPSTIDPKDNLYDRKVDCPVCHSHIKVRSVKPSAVRVQARDTDFMVYYNEPNFMLYDAWVCPKCGYAALSSQFKVISERQIKLIKENISTKWVSKDYPEVFNIDIAIERYKLALFSAITRQAKPGEKAAICLKTAWLYRLKGDEKNDVKFLSNALEGFLLAFEKASFPINGLDEPSFTYLMGELYRRIGDNQNALLWFSKVMANRTSSSRIKDMTRDQKDLIVSTYEEETSSNESNSISEEQPSKQNFFKLLFSGK